MSELSKLKEERASVRSKLIPLKSALEEAREAHEKAFKAYTKLKQVFDALELEIAELEKEVKVIPFGRSGRRDTDAKVDPVTSLKSAMTTMSDDEKRAFLRELGLLPQNSIEGES